MVTSNLDKKTKVKKRKISPQTDYFLSQGITYIDYKDVVTLRKFIRQERIVHRKYTRLTAKNQRRVAQAIERARQMALPLYLTVEQNE